LARTLDAKAHAVRRDAFIDSAQRLIQTRGYEQTSIQDVLDDLETSKGAFYHYFESKAALLEGVIARMVDGALAAVAPVVDDPRTTAPEKVLGVFTGIASYKVARRDLLIALMQTWFSDDNAIVREKFRRRVAAQLTPMLTRIIRQGVAEGSFDVTSPEHASRVLVGLILGANEHAGDLYLGWHEGRLPFEVVEGALNAYPEAFERLLGAPAGSLRWYDDKQLREWFS
jgi:AcrR family transcriptional regulator